MVRIGSEATLYGRHADFDWNKQGLATMEKQVLYAVVDLYTVYAKKFIPGSSRD
jgi:hypothetical protein